MRAARGPSIQLDQPVDGDLADRHEPLLVALADDPDERAVGVEVLAVQVDRLADAQAGGVQQFEQGAVTGVAGRLEQALGLVDRQRLW